MIGSCWDVTDRRKPDETVESSVGLLRAILEATADGVLVIDRLGEVVMFNDRFLALWAIPRELAAQRSDQAMLAFVLNQLEDPASFLQRVHELYACPGEESFELVRFRDGRILEQTVAGHSTVIGVMTFRAAPDRHYAREDLELAEELARRIVLRVANQRLVSALRQALRIRDELFSAQLDLCGVARVEWAIDIDLALRQDPRRDGGSVCIGERAGVLERHLRVNEVEHVLRGLELDALAQLRARPCLLGQGVRSDQRRVLRVALTMLAVATRALLVGVKRLALVVLRSEVGLSCDPGGGLVLGLGRRRGRGRRCGCGGRRRRGRLRRAPTTARGDRDDQDQLAHEARTVPLLGRWFRAMTRQC